MLPPSSASIGSIIFCWLVLGPHREIPKLVRVLRSLLMFGNQHGENRAQKHENEGLHKPDKHLEKVKRNGQDWRQPWNHGRHRLENTFARVNISEQPETESYWAK